MAYTAPIDEKELVRQLQDPGSAHKAFEVLLRSYSEQIYWQVRNLVGNHDDANDIVQNVFIKAWNNLHNFRGEAKLSTWLYKIAVNESLNFIKKENSRKLQTEDLPEDAADSFIANIKSDPYFDGDELQLQLQGAVAALPDKQRLVFTMRYFEEMKYEEISEVLGTSVGALKASYHHAVKKITESLLS